MPPPVASLKNQLRIHTSTLLTARSTQQILSEQDGDQNQAALKQKLLAQSARQRAHNQQCLYRACATLTAFRARDPDPRAVDAGAILGLRIDVVVRGRFLRPYYVLLNRPFAARHLLRVHRHTLPPCIPLAGLAARYLPAPASGARGRGAESDGDREDGNERGKKQDLARFARALRREVVRYHHRLGVVADLRRAAGLGRKGKMRQEGAEEEGEEGGGETAGQLPKTPRLVDISPADAEAKHVTIEWADGRTGRLVMGDDGEIVKLVVVGENGRDREAGRELLGGAVRVEDVVKRLAAVV